MASEMMILRHGSDKIGVTDAIYVPYLRLNKISLVERERERERVTFSLSTLYERSEYLRAEHIDADSLALKTSK